MTAAAFARGFLDLEGFLTPILASLVSKDKARHMCACTCTCMCRPAATTICSMRVRGAAAMCVHPGRHRMHPRLPPCAIHVTWLQPQAATAMLDDTSDAGRLAMDLSKAFIHTILTTNRNMADEGPGGPLPTPQPRAMQAAGCSRVCWRL